MANQPKKSLTLDELLTILQLFSDYGLPAILSAIDKIKASSGPDFTVAEIRDFMTGVNPPPENP